MSLENLKRKSSPDLQHWLKNKLRRISYQWPPLKDAVKNARISRGKYRCASCLGENFGPKEINRDHIIPVEDPHFGFTNWNDYILRLLVPSSEQIQILCKPCHAAKTLRENFIRQQVKKIKKNNDDI